MGGEATMTADATRGARRWAVLVLAGTIGLLLLAGADLAASAAQGDGPPYDTVNQCIRAKPIDVPVMDWSCVGSRADGWTPVQAQDPFDNPRSLVGTFVVLGLFWTAIPLLIAASMASNRGESVGKAVLLTFFLGWLGLAIVYFGQDRSVNTVKGLAAVGQDRASAPRARPPTSVPPMRTEVAWPSSTPAAGTAAAETPAADDPSARLRQLEELRDEGLITDDEYDAQRSRILDDL